MAFNDGEPIDAAKLAALETKLLAITDVIPTIGGTTNTINATSTSGTTVVGSIIPQIWAGNSESKKVSYSSIQSYELNYSAAKLTAVPKAIIATPHHGKGTSRGGPVFYIDQNSMSTSSATLYATLPSSSDLTTSCSFWFQVIVHN
jgi:hypothetical protein